MYIVKWTIGGAIILATKLGRDVSKKLRCREELRKLIGLSQMVSGAAKSLLINLFIFIFV